MPIQAFSALTTGGVVASSSGSAFYAFGFRASYVRVDNFGSVPIWALFDAAVQSSQGSGSTGTGICIQSCANQNTREFVFGQRLSATKVTIYATSTSASGVAVTALGL